MNSSITRGFASDNNAGIHPILLEAIQQANTGHVIAYGDDVYTRNAEKVFRSFFGEGIDVYFVLTGTGANVLSLASLTKSINSVICASTSHINVDECGAPEKFCNCKLLTIETPDGKLTPDTVKKHLHGFGFEHHAQPCVISISQSTEMGTVYTPAEIKALSNLAKEYGLYLHADGARIANAAVSLGLDFKEFTSDVGIDVLSFGGTKNGMMFGEAVVFFNRELTKDFRYYRKQSTQLLSKMRYIGAQFAVYLESNIWKLNAQHANKMAQLLYDRVKDLLGVQVTQKVQSNAVFAVIPERIIKPLMDQYFFYMWDESRNEARWMTSFDTTEEDIEGFTSLLKSLLNQ